MRLVELLGRYHRELWKKKKKNSHCKYYSFVVMRILLCLICLVLCLNRKQSYVWMLSRFSPVQLCATLWAVAHQAPLSMEFSKQEHWSGAVAHQAPLSMEFSKQEHWSGAVAHQAPLSMEFSKQEHWSGLPCSPPGDLFRTQIEPTSPISTCIGRWLLYN